MHVDRSQYVAFPRPLLNHGIHKGSLFTFEGSNIERNGKSECARWVFPRVLRIWGNSTRLEFTFYDWLLSAIPAGCTYAELIVWAQKGTCFLHAIRWQWYTSTFSWQDGLLLAVWLGGQKIQRRRQRQRTKEQRLQPNEERGERTRIQERFWRTCFIQEVCRSLSRYGVSMRSTE